MNCSSVNLNRTLDADSLLCDYPNYFLYSCMLALMASAAFLSMHAIIRMPAVVVLTVIFEALFLTELEPLFWLYDLRRSASGTSR